MREQTALAQYEWIGDLTVIVNKYRAALELHEPLQLPPSSFTKVKDVLVDIRRSIMSGSDEVTKLHALALLSLGCDFTPPLSPEEKSRRSTTNEQILSLIERFCSLSAQEELFSIEEVWSHCYVYALLYLMRRTALGKKKPKQTVH